MNQEPVAWVCEDDIWNLKFKVSSIAYLSDSKNEICTIPLYTHPAKTLTDEEIIEVFESPFHPNTTGKINDEVIAFARAILRKAQEK
jgi:hypothetical protein